MVLPKSSKMGRTKMPITWIKSDASRQVTFTKRKKGLKKKVEELAILCGVEVCMICFGPQGGTATTATVATASGGGGSRNNNHSGGGASAAAYSWGLPGVTHVIDKFCSLSKEEQEKKKLDNSSLLEQQIKKVRAEVKMRKEQTQRLERERAYLLWDERLNAYAPEQLRLLADAVLQRAAAAASLLQTAPPPPTPPPSSLLSTPPSSVFDASQQCRLPLIPAVPCPAQLPSSTHLHFDHNLDYYSGSFADHQLQLVSGDGVVSAAASNAYDATILTAFPESSTISHPQQPLQELQNPIYNYYNSNYVDVDPPSFLYCCAAMAASVDNNEEQCYPPLLYDDNHLNDNHVALMQQLQPLVPLLSFPTLDMPNGDNRYRDHKSVEDMTFHATSTSDGGVSAAMISSCIADEPSCAHILSNYSPAAAAEPFIGYGHVDEAYIRAAISAEVLQAAQQVVSHGSRDPKAAEIITADGDQVLPRRAIGDIEDIRNVMMGAGQALWQKQATSDVGGEGGSGAAEGEEEEEVGRQAMWESNNNNNSDNNNNNNNNNSSSSSSSNISRNYSGMAKFTTTTATRSSSSSFGEEWNPDLSIRSSTHQN